MAREALRVLVLEDDDNDTRLLLRALHSAGFAATPKVVSNRADYRAALEGDFDVIIADFALQDFDALEALRILRERERDLPFIIVTGTVAEEVVVECMRQGASDYLLKDRLVRLGEAVRRARRAHELRAQNRQAEAELAAAREQAQRDWDELLGRLAQLAEEVGLATDAESVYRALFRFCAKSTPADGIFVAAYDSDTGMRTCTYSMTVVDGVYEEHDISKLPQLPLNESPQSRAILSGEVILTGDLQELFREVPNYDVGSDDDVKPPLSSAAVPLRVQGRTIGAFEVQSTRLAAFGEEHVVALTMAANHAAIALENVGLLEREKGQRQAAEESEQRYRELIEHASDGIVVFDREGRIRRANPSFAALLGVDADSIPGSRIERWVEAGEFERRPRVFHRLEVGETAKSERTFVRSDGRRVPAEIHTTRLPGDSFQAEVRDISERKRAEEELLNEKRFSDTLINSLPGIFYLFDEEARLLRWNANLNVVTGLSDEQIRAMAPAEFFPEEYREYIVAKVQEGFAEGATSAEAPLLGQGGQHVPYVFSSVRMIVEGRPYLMGTGLDISERRAAEERVTELNLELGKRLDRLSALHEIDMAITGSVDLRLTMSVVLDKVSSELGADASRAWAFNKEGSTLYRVASRGFSVERQTPEVRLGEGALGRCALERRLIRMRHEHDESASGGSGRRPIVDCWLVPLLSKGQLQGVLELCGTRELDGSDDWVQFLEALALQAAIAIDNVVMFQGLERSTVELTVAYDATIEGWARALDMRDHETEGHSRRVTELTVELARHMGVEESRIAHIRRGALLHDIGKLGVPDAILGKPGPLAAEEVAVMRRHAALGYELLAPIAFLRPAAEIPYCHHEAWDGSGYPRGLRGEEIPFPARIFAVADVFDALTSDRPYRGAWPRERALQYLRDRAGLQFDSRVVAAFMELHGGSGMAGAGGSGSGDDLSR